MPATGYTTEGYDGKGEGAMFGQGMPVFHLFLLILLISHLPQTQGHDQEGFIPIASNPQLQHDEDSLLVVSAPNSHFQRGNRWGSTTPHDITRSTGVEMAGRGRHAHPQK